MIRFLIAVFFCSYSVAISQTVTITSKNVAPGKVVLSLLEGENLSKVDSVMSDGSGRVVYSFHEQATPGMYRFTFNRNTWIDVILDGEDVELVSLTESVKVVRSESNRLFYAYRTMNEQYKTKSELLQLVLARYPREDDYYQTTLEKVAELQSGYQDFIQRATSSRETSFIARYIRSAQLPVIDLVQSQEKQLAYLKSHALEHVDFSDEELINSDIFTTKTIEYLTYFRNPQFPKELLAKEFNKAVDTILTKARVNRQVYKHITQYFLKGFKEFGFEECINYILDNYVIKDELCLDNASGSVIQRMIDQKKNLPVGGTVPDISLPDMSDDLISMTSINTERIIILFYSSTCPHCRNMLPSLAEVMKTEKGKGVSVFAVSLDTNKSDWKAFIQSFSNDWTNVIDGEGWDGNSAKDFYLYATPTMFVIDKSRSILAKPITLNELLTLL